MDTPFLDAKNIMEEEQSATETRGEKDLVVSRSERIAVIVATHTNDPLLERCLSGVQSMLHQADDLIFIDNGSPDDVGGWVTHRFPGTPVVRLDRKRMFCGGYNAGIMLAIQRRYDFALILNADAEVISTVFWVNS